MHKNGLERCGTALDELETGMEREADKSSETGCRKVKKMTNPGVDASSFEPGRFRTARTSLGARRA